MRDRAPAYRDPVLHFHGLRLIALREGGRTEEASGTENEREMPIRAPEHPHHKPAGFAGLKRFSSFGKGRRPKYFFEVQ